jgi:hypothetical protein
MTITVARGITAALPMKKNPKLGYALGVAS